MDSVDDLANALGDDPFEDLDSQEEDYSEQDNYEREDADKGTPKEISEDREYMPPTREAEDMLLEAKKFIDSYKNN